ncbi:unnamed protein product [Torque teno virus 26]|uniref:Capsid protein n=1 Tax=Torque teno virus 26 TaxID=687365 RepID=Q9DUC7_9VIRU|nr:hypothetical protein TTV26_gp2 [Torque teno virus 26]BAB19310.1 unnamed protein product [Torque teno virus 26]
MAWWWRRWPRRRRRWRRWGRRRVGSWRRRGVAGRRRRGRRVRRRRRRRVWRRGRRWRLRRRRRLRRYFRNTLILRQWQPTTIKSLRISGWFPGVVCSNRRSQNNYIVHLPDIPARGGGFGGNISITKWNLSMLWHENLMNRNRWSRRNNDLDLVRYLGGSWKFYRDPDRDFIATYSLESPMTTNQYSHLQSHPQIMLLRRHRILIPSLKTKPRGKPYVKRKFKPPKLMRNQWYFQAHFCNVNLIKLTVVGLDLQKAWLRRGTESPIAEFAVLQQSLYNNISLTATETNSEEQKKTWENVWAFPMSMTMNFRELLKTLGATDAELKDGPKRDSVPTLWKKYVTSNKMTENVFNDRQKKINWLVSNSGITTTNTLSRTMYFDRICGMFSSYVLDDTVRWDGTLKKAYVGVRYNPLIDEGTGNKVWIDPVTKKDTKFQPPQSLVLLEGQPLWLLLFGYTDWIKKFYADRNPGTTYRVTLLSPWTYPKLTNKDLYGYVPLGDDFCAGRHPYRQYKITPEWETLWYPMVFNQEPALEAIVNCGPWMPRDEEARSWQLNLGYQFRFKLGGHLPPGQPPEDPCKQPTHDLPETNMLQLAVQASNPRTVDEPFHGWDLRRGMFSASSIKRMREYQTDDENFPDSPAKRSRYDPPTEGEPGALPSGSLQALKALFETPQTPGPLSPSWAKADEAPEVLQLQLQRELQRQRKQQQRLQQGIQEMLLSMKLTQMGHHIDHRLL